MEDYCKSGKKPNDIPSHAGEVYAQTGWAGMGDWLGTGKVAHGQYRAFKKSRAFVRGLKLKSGADWSAYCKSGKKPADIPYAPQSVYASDGWAGMADWLGAGRRRPGTWRPFKKARAFVRGLGLKSQLEWHEYSISGKKPDDIPNAPQSVYGNDGWAGTGDWLGYGTQHSGKRSQADGVGITR
jgi:Integrase repeat unit